MKPRYRDYMAVPAYVAGITLVLISAGVVLHELGHLALGLFIECDNLRLVLFDTIDSSTYTLMACPHPPTATAAVLSSFLFILPVAGLFLLRRPRGDHYIGHVLLGIGILLAGRDIAVLADSGGVQLLVVLIGGLLALYGEERLIREVVAAEVRHSREMASAG